MCSARRLHVSGAMLVKSFGRQPYEARMRLIREPVKPRRSPIIALRLGSEKYASWKQFLDAAYWNVELRD